VSFVAITLCVASQRVFMVVSVYFVIDSVRKLLDTPSHVFPESWVHEKIKKKKTRKCEFSLQCAIREAESDQTKT